MASVTVYDLSLAKALATGQSATVAPGDDVIFTNTVTNNGNVTSGEPITITDTIPAGMTLNDPDWTAGAGNTATYDLTTPAAAGASTSVDITLAVSGSFGGGTLANYAEITTDQGSD